MTPYTDHTFHIGAQHLRQGSPCQDHALSGRLSSEAAFAIVSDGCSRGGMTDIGARLVALATRQALCEHHERGVREHAATIAARDAYLRSWQQSIGLSTEDLLATSLSIAGSAACLSIAVAGDGVVLTRTVGGSLVARKYEWHESMPFYPAYNLAASTREGFVRHHGENPAALCVETWELSGNEPVLRNAEHYDVRSGMREIHSLNGDPSEPYEMAAVFSDGVTVVEGWHWQDVVIALSAFKSTRGQFAVRRMNRFLREAQLSGRGPIDDVACAAIIFTDMENGGSHDTHYHSDPACT